MLSILLTIGVAVGVVSGSLGVGGGILMVPAFLEFIAGMDQKTAIGTSLGVIVGIATINAWRLNRGEQPDWGLIGGVAISAILCAYLSARLASGAPEGILKTVFAMLALGLAIRTFALQPKAKREEGATSPIPQIAPEVSTERPQRGFFRRALLTGVAMGSASGVTGIGGGGIFVPLALWLGLSTNKKVVAASNAIMVPVAASGLFAYLTANSTASLQGVLLGQFHPQTALITFAGALPGSILGRKINKHLSISQRKAIMGSLLIIIAVRMLIRAFAA